MTTFSQSLKLELIGDGQQSGTWGQTTNKNLGTLLEQAITGVISITMTDTNYTLTSFNGVSDEARNAVIVATGTNSAQRDIIAPLVDKIYTINNSTVGGYAIRIRGASGAAVTIPNGVTTSVYCDGSDFYNMQVGTTGNETINGNLTVTGTANIAGATTLGANLSGTTAAFSGAISSASPAFTGVPTSPTAPNGTNTTQIATTAFVANTITAIGLGTMATQNANAVAITGGSISGVAVTGGSINNTPIGATTRSTGAFTSMDLTTALPVASGGTGVTTSTGTGSVVLSASPTLTGTPLAPTAAAGTNTTQIATTAFIATAIAAALPSGVITMWSGSIGSIPSGWYLCNGANGTPDLRNKFIVGAGSTYAVNATGGSADAIVVSHTHTATSAVSDPGHSHNVVGGGGGGSSATLLDSAQRNYATSSATTGITVSTTVNSTGSSGTNANLPPYFALAYIMKA